jgi:hypothetical protein
MDITIAKIFAYFLLFSLLVSCDRSYPISINNTEAVYISTDCGRISLHASRFGNAIFFSQSYKGTFLLHPDSLRLACSPKCVTNPSFLLGGEFKPRKNKESFWINNNFVSITVNPSYQIPLDLDTVTIAVLPCSYIICNNKPALTDTVIIKGAALNLKRR